MPTSQDRNLGEYDIGAQSSGQNVYLGEVLTYKAMGHGVTNIGPQGHGQVKYCLGDNVNSLHP